MRVEKLKDLIEKERIQQAIDAKVCPKCNCPFEEHCIDLSQMLAVCPTDPVEKGKRIMTRQGRIYENP